MSFATPGFGSTVHMAMELLKSSAGIDMLHVPYNGVAPALTDVIARPRACHAGERGVGQRPSRCGLGAGAGGFQSSKSIGHLPNAPDSRGVRHPNYEAIQWFGLLAPAGTPKEIVARLHEETIVALKTERIVKWMATEGGDAGGNSPEEFSKMIASEVAKWSAVARAANIQPN